MFVMPFAGKVGRRGLADSGRNPASDTRNEFGGQMMPIRRTNREICRTLAHFGEVDSST